MYNKTLRSWPAALSAHTHKIKYFDKLATILTRRGKTSLRAETEIKPGTIPTRWGNVGVGASRGRPSPRGRGKPAEFSRIRSQCGPSPRGWGNGGGGIAILHHSDHPHAGGENSVSNIVLVSLTTSRGWENDETPGTPKEDSGPSPRGKWGNLPALAAEPGPSPRGGKTMTLPQCSPDHPHAVGGKLQPSPTRSKPPDHPHAVGKLLPRAPAASGRTIPTRVGKTYFIARLPEWTADHPHAGGENLLPLPLTGGPSPRGWGKLSP